MEREQKKKELELKEMQRLNEERLAEEERLRKLKEENERKRSEAVCVLCYENPYDDNTEYKLHGCGCLVHKPCILQHIQTGSNDGKIEFFCY